MIPSRVSLTSHPSILCMSFKFSCLSGTGNLIATCIRGLRMSHKIVYTPTTYATISEVNWQMAISFFKSLRWCIDDGMRVSDIELAYQFHHSGFRFEGHDSVAKTTTILRKVINQSTKRFSDFPLFVGQQKAGSISLEKTLPAGHIRGSRPLVAIQALKNLKNLASVLLHGRSHALSLWDTPF